VHAFDLSIGRYRHPGHKGATAASCEIHTISKARGPVRAPPGFAQGKVQRKQFQQIVAQLGQMLRPYMFSPAERRLLADTNAWANSTTDNLIFDLLKRLPNCSLQRPLWLDEIVKKVVGCTELAGSVFQATWRHPTTWTAVGSFFCSHEIEQLIMRLETVQQSLSGRTNSQNQRATSYNHCEQEAPTMQLHSSLIHIYMTHTLVNITTLAPPGLRQEPWTIPVN